MWLGGDNFDELIMNFAVSNIREEYGIDPTTNTLFMAELKKAAQRAKERLSSASSVDIFLLGLLRDKDDELIDVDLEITRDEFEKMIRPLIKRTKMLTERALKNANLTKDEIDFVLMAGNSTMIPMVQTSMENMFGVDKVKRNRHPKHCVALGAAILAQRSKTEKEDWICYWPSPEDPNKTCEKRNLADAEYCEHCNAPRVIITG